MKTTEKKYNNNAAMERRILAQSEAALVTGADRPGISYDSDCCHTQGYPTGNWRKTRIGFVTYKVAEYFCPSCETFFTRSSILFFD